MALECSIVKSGAYSTDQPKGKRLCWTAVGHTQPDVSLPVGAGCPFRKQPTVTFAHVDIQCPRVLAQPTVVIVF